MRRETSGFSLIELLIAAAVMAVVLVGLLNMFDQINRLSRAQIDITEMQQSIRVGHAEIVETTRMAGRGKLPNSEMLLGPAIMVRNNVAGSNRSLLLDDDAPRAVANTDILTVRGVIEGSIFIVDSADPASFAAPQASIATGPQTGTVRVTENTFLGYDPQEPQAFLDLGDPNDPEPVALIFVNAINPSIYGVAKLTKVTNNLQDPSSGSYDPLTSHVLLEFTTNYTDTSDIGYAYQQLNALVLDSDLDGDLDTRGLPEFLGGVVFVGILDEYRFYVRDERSGGSDPRLMPRLARARMYPGTQLPYGGDAANLTLDIADNIFDLQVALGFDAGLASSEYFAYDEDNVGDDDILMPNDWAYSASSPDLTADEWVIDFNNADAGFPEEALDLYFARITTVGRAAFPDLGYDATASGGDLPTMIEDHDYSADAQFNALFTGDGRRYRRMLLETVVELRNIS